MGLPMNDVHSSQIIFVLYERGLFPVLHTYPGQSFQFKSSFFIWEKIWWILHEDLFRIRLIPLFDVIAFTVGATNEVATSPCASVRIFLPVPGSNTFVKSLSWNGCSALCIRIGEPLWKNEWVIYLIASPIERNITPGVWISINMQ